MSTIFAVSSGAAPAAIAVLRISGPDALAAAVALAGPLPTPRLAVLRKLRDPASGAVLDHVLLLVFPGPGSATGEDLVEIHAHGGRAVVAAIEQVLGMQPGLRRAEPGEFTRRALLNGRIDLTQAEGLGDLLAAETESQRRAAMLAAEGGIRNRVEDWSARLLMLAAQVEAQLDFADEDDVASADDASRIAVAAKALADEMAAIVANPPVERLRDGIRVVLAGPPNSGKSTLINALAERDAAIVSPIAGTTRDRIEVPITRDGIAYILTDTAGLSDSTDDPVEAIGIARARSAIATADVTLWLGDARPEIDALWLQPRADELSRGLLAAGPELAVSARTGFNLDRLWRAIATRSVGLLPRLDDIAMNRRQRDLTAECATHLTEAAASHDLLIVAEHLRLGRAALDRITGHSDTEAMLDALFGKFCIGK